MSVTEYQPIVEAINSLQSNPVKDYLLPFVTLVGSAVLGVGASIYTNNFQDKINAERHKLRMLNHTTLAVAEMRINLVTIKSNYHGTLNDDPIHRLLAIPPLVNSMSIPTFEASELTFLAQNIGKDGKFNNKWIRVEVINSLFSNYKSVIEQWVLFSRKMIEVKNHLAQHVNIEQGINNNDVIEIFGRPAVIQLSDLTEKMLMLTDELIVEFSCFLLGFPHSVQNLVTKSVKRKYGGIMAYQLPDKDEYGSEMLKHVPLFNEQKMVELQQRSVEEIRERYRYTYS